MLRAFASGLHKQDIYIVLRALHKITIIDRSLRPNLITSL